MTRSRDFAIVYQSIRTDERFAGIFHDDHHLATWVRLLLAAEKSWPDPADLPVSARKASVRALVGAGLIELLPAHQYRVHGLDAERAERRRRAVEAANARWMQEHSGSTP